MGNCRTFIPHPREALDAGVFGAPSDVVAGDVFRARTGPMSARSG